MSFPDVSYYVILRASSGWADALFTAPKVYSPFWQAAFFSLPEPHQRPLLRAPSMFAVLAAAARNAAGDGSQLQAKHPSRSFNANITDANGVEREPDKPCFLCRTSCYSGPATVSVTGSEADKVVVWDTERGICPDGELYIHYVPGARKEDMTAGAGAEIHTYNACVFDTLPVSGTGCQAFSGQGCRVNLDDCMTHEWRVAREGSSC